MSVLGLLLEQLSRPWSVVWKDLVEGLVVAMLTAGVFVAFWPR